MISIFAKQAFLNTSPNTPFISKEESYHGRGHLQRVSSIIRGNQIAERGGFRLNPESDFENDVCIYVKPHLKRGMDFEFKGKRAYLDIIDGHALGEVLINHPEVGVITCSWSDFNIMRRSLPKHEIHYIPQHHANFERIQRTRKEVKRVGIIGEENAFNHIPNYLENALKSIGMELVKFSGFFSRQDIIDFYMNIDIQLVWRPYKKRLSNPLKIVNAMSFGIPSVALDEEAFQEVKGSYIPMSVPADIIASINTLRDASTYELFSTRCLKDAENYHIDNVVKKYKELDYAN